MIVTRHAAGHCLLNLFPTVLPLVALILVAGSGDQMVALQEFKANITPA